MEILSLMAVLIRMAIMYQIHTMTVPKNRDLSTMAVRQRRLPFRMTTEVMEVTEKMVMKVIEKTQDHDIPAP
jgi:hypothetical protein